MIVQVVAGDSGPEVVLIPGQLMTADECESRLQNELAPKFFDSEGQPIMAQFRKCVLFNPTYLRDELDAVAPASR